MSTIWQIKTMFMNSLCYPKRSVVQFCGCHCFNVSLTGHCAKTFAILHRALEHPLISDTKWLVIADDDTILRYILLVHFNSCVCVHACMRATITRRGYYVIPYNFTAIFHVYFNILLFQGGPHIIYKIYTEINSLNKLKLHEFNKHK